MLEDENEDFDARAAEARELAVLLDKGFEFQVRKKKYLIKQPYLGTLDYLAEQFLKLDVNREILESGEGREIFDEQKRMLVERKNTRIAARIVSIAVLNSRWKITFLTWFYARMFRWSVTSSDLMKLTGIILRASNLQDFSTSIALMSVNRTTAPRAIED